VGRLELAWDRARAETRALTRRQWLTLGLGVSALVFAGTARGDEPRVPARLQAELLAKVAAYDTRFGARTRGQALVLIVQVTGHADSERFAASIRAELGMQARIGGVLHVEQIIQFASAAELASLCRERLPAIVYLSPGLSSAAPAIAAALAGLDLLSVSPVPEDITSGIVLGFEVISGKPKLLVNLPNARRQNVAFKPELLRLARVIQ
jgi:hypothetical protein